MVRKFFGIAREYCGFVPAGEDPNVVVRAVRYITEVHGFSYLKDVTVWFHQTLNVLLELVHPSQALAPKGTDFLEDIAAGIRKSGFRS
jgi:hypothetical protein